MGITVINATNTGITMNFIDVRSLFLNRRKAAAAQAEKPMAISALTLSPERFE
jgi:hypothetical protein